MNRAQAQPGVRVIVPDPIYYSRSKPPLPAGLEGEIERIYLEDDVAFLVRVGELCLFYTDAELNYLEVVP